MRDPPPIKGPGRGGAQIPSEIATPSPSRDNRSPPDSPQSRRQALRAPRRAPAISAATLPPSLRQALRCRRAMAAGAAPALFLRAGRAPLVTPSPQESRQPLTALKCPFFIVKSMSFGDSSAVGSVVGTQRGSCGKGRQVGRCGGEINRA